MKYYTYIELRKNIEIYKSFKTHIPLRCEHCGSTFIRDKKNIINKINNPIIKKTFCSPRCRCAANRTALEVVCKNCNIKFLKRLGQIKKSLNHFCSKSCAASYNNTHKKHGTRRSKLEKWLEIQLVKRYQNLIFNFNNKEAIQSELDIFIPSLNLAFELNGIFHYEPIYGKEKLASIQNNDGRKFQACIEHNIELCILDASSIKHFKPERCQKFLDIICSIIDQKLTR